MMRTPSAALCAAVLLQLSGCGPLALEAPHVEATFASEWNERPDRRWIGERFWANRLQDWTLEDGGAQCTEGRPRFGMRTLFLLTDTLEAGEGSFEQSVIIDAGPGSRSGSAAGFLIGAGGPHVDFRITAHVAGAPAEDGGVLALVDGAGRVRFVDFETPLPGKAGGWGIRADAALADLPELDAARLGGQGFGAEGPRPLRLTLVGASFSGERTLTLIARDAASGQVLSTAFLEDAPETAFEGGLALVSHRGPTGVDEATGEALERRGYRFTDWTCRGDLLAYRGERAFGPLLFTHYTVDLSGEVGAKSPTLRMTVQSVPLGPEDARLCALELGTPGKRGGYEPVAEASFVEGSCTFTFEVEGGFDPDADTPFRLVYTPFDRYGDPDGRREQVFDGTIRAQPEDAMTIGLVSCQKSYTGGLAWNGSRIWFPHGEIARGLEHADPDLLYFAGDQIYEGDITPATRAPLEAATLDYLGKWYRHGWSFRELTRRIPAVVVPDDHDVYHGNIWGNGGVRAEAPVGPDGQPIELSRQDRGGYVMAPAFVNAVHRTQVAHLPPPVDGATLPNGITTFHTVLDWGGGSFAVLSDRMFKSPPSVVLPEAEVRNGWSRRDDFDAPRDADVPGAELLGPRQEAMLARWGREWSPSSGAWFRACLSQTPFVNLATLPAEAKSGGAIPTLKIPGPGEAVTGDRRAADMDSGGWPQGARRRAVELLRDAGAIHLAGDQHLGAVVQYGIDRFGEGAAAFSGPAAANTWPRRWFPDPSRRAAAGPGDEDPVGPTAPPWLGRFLDGFGNRMTVFAVSNPRRRGQEPAALHDRSPGYGVVRVERLGDAGERGRARVTFEAWPRYADPAAGEAGMYEGWPVVFEVDGRATTFLSRAGHAGARR